MIIKNNKFIYILLILILFLINSCNKKVKPDRAETKVLESIKNWEELSEKGYSIKYPESWILDKTGKMGSSFILFSEKTSNKDKFRDNINLLVQEITDTNLDLEQFVSVLEKQIENTITKADFIESRRIKEPNDEYHKLLYTGKQGIYNLKFEQHYRIKEGKIYILTFTCEKDEYQKYSEIGKKILASFKIE